MSRSHGLIGIILILLIIINNPVHANVVQLAKEIDSHVFFLKDKNGSTPIIDVVSNNRVKVLLPNQEKKTIRYRQVGLIERKLSPVGRVTICDTKGRSQFQKHGSGDSVSTMEETHFTFDLVADRFIPNSYVAIVYTHPDSPKNKGIAFSKIGNLEAGKLISKIAVFPNIVLPKGTSYKFEFYTDGFPLEMFSLSRIAGNTQSHSLLIPWKVRLDEYLEQAKEKKLTIAPRPFEISFLTLDGAQLKSRGIKSIKANLSVNADGTVEILNEDSQLTQSEQENLSRDCLLWRFFPAVKEGKPHETEVSAPLKL